MMQNRINRNELLSGSIFRHVLRLSTPMIVAFIFVTSYHFIDRYFVSQLGDIATAAIGMAFIVQLLIISIGVGVGSGINSYIARNLGADKAEKAKNTALHSFILAFAIGGGLAIIGLLVQEPLFRMIGAEGELLKLITEYLTILFIFTPINLLSMFANSVFQGWGDTVSPMKFSLIGTFSNLILDPCLIFGLGPLPELGIKGAAWATGIGRSIAILYVAYFILIRHKPVPLFHARFKYNWNIVKGIFQVGLPSSLSQVLTSVAMGFIFFILDQFGPKTKAAYTIVFTYEMVIFLPAIGISNAVTILTGHNFGARLFERVNKTYFTGSSVAFTIMFISATIIFLSPETFAGIFAQSEDVLQITATALRITVCGSVFISIYLCSVASFQGLGLGRQYLFANVVRLYVLQVPVAFIGAHLLGLNGVWIGMMAVNMLSAIILFVWHRYIYKHRIITGIVEPL